MLMKDDLTSKTLGQGIAVIVWQEKKQETTIILSA